MIILYILILLSTYENTHRCIYMYMIIILVICLWIFNFLPFIKNMCPLSFPLFMHFYLHLTQLSSLFSSSSFVYLGRFMRTLAFIPKVSQANC